MMKIYEILKNYYDRNRDNDKLWGSIEELSEMFEDYKEKDQEGYWSLMRKLHEVWNGMHYDCLFAKYEVENMYHLEGDREVKGEYWSKKQTDDLFQVYKSKIHSGYNEYDFYVGLNASYHDLVNSKRVRFPDKYESEIVEDAVAFWFQDADMAEGKVWWYFNR